MMNILDELGHNVIKTDLTRKLTIDGKTEVYPVYKIALSECYYNDKNDRIATIIDRYSKTKHEPLQPSKTEEYNSIIEQFIVESNEQAIFRTKNNIRMIGQREAGVVLADGRVVDGNRRFTCLRQLAKENSSFGYFEAVILDKDVDERQIKLLELMIQHGEEQRVDYDPFDMIVGMYRDIREDGLFTSEEYAAATDSTLKFVEDRLKAGDTIIDFLEFLNMPKYWYIAKEIGLYGYISGTGHSTSIPSLLNRCDEKYVDDLKKIVYTNIVLNTSSSLLDILSKLTTSDLLNSYIKHAKLLCDNFKIQLDATPISDYDELKAFTNMHSDTKAELTNLLDSSFLKQKIHEVHSQPSKNVSKAASMMKSIDSKVIGHLTDRETEELKQNVTKLAGYVNQYSEMLDLPTQVNPQIQSESVNDLLSNSFNTVQPKSYKIDFGYITDSVRVIDNHITGLLKTIVFDKPITDITVQFVNADGMELSDKYSIENVDRVDVEFKQSTSSLSECYMLVRHIDAPDIAVSQVIRFYVSMNFIANFDF